MRGSGKSTWVRHEFPEAHKIDLLDEGVYQSYLRNVSVFGNQLNALPENSTVFIDEIQRLPDLLNEVHRFIEDKNFRFILTGSSARKLKRSGVNLLAGRAIKKILYPFTPGELGDKFHLDEVLKFGSIPLVWNVADKQETLESYVQMYLKEEIQAEAIVRNLSGFARFLPVAGLFHGQTLNVSSLARDAGVARTTIEGYVEILEDTLLAFRLPAYSGKLRVREKRSPKLYWMDPGLARAAKMGFNNNSGGEFGHLFEGWLAVFLKSGQEYFKMFDDIFYWSPAEAKKTEVDFLLKRGNDFIAIEVKYTANINPEHLKGLKAINSLKGLQRRILVCLVDQKQTTNDNIEILPINDFINIINEKKLWK
ncbi:MAG: ATP-binding protein [Oligoflexia bacterium]|nr:ATP-binding protein [Oligoflexia bacterium]